MNVDLSIHRMAFREADSLAVAQVLVAKKRNDLELRELRERVLAGADASRTHLECSLHKMEAQSEALRQTAEHRAETARHLDRTA